MPARRIAEALAMAALLGCAACAPSATPAASSPPPSPAPLGLSHPASAPPLTGSSLLPPEGTGATMRR